MSDDKSVQSQKDEGRKISGIHGGQSKLSETDEPLKETFFKKFGGMLMALSASFFFSVSFLIVKILGNHGFKAFGCSVIFNLGVLIPCFIGILLHEKGPKAHERSRIFKEIWPLTISDKSTILKILLVSRPLSYCTVISSIKFSIFFSFKEHYKGCRLSCVVSVFGT